MYEEFFRLHHRPFAAAPQVERFYPVSAVEQARKTICRCIERAEGTALIIGPSGTGKTLLCQVLARQFSARFQTAVLTCGNLGSRRALLQAVLFELGQPYRGIDEGELRLSLVDHLLESAKDSLGLVLFIDEAHTLPWRLLEEIRLITNLASGGEPRVRIVLAGNGTLEEHFANPKLDSFSQRVVARCYLGSLDRTETAAYVRHQVAMAGGNPDIIISKDALESVYRATDGIPRLINQVCDHALILANLANQITVERATVDEAWADLQQLPSPWSGGVSTRSVAADGETGSPVVEFGGLDDEFDDVDDNDVDDSDADDSDADELADDADENYADDSADDAGDEAPNAIPFHRRVPVQPVDLDARLGEIDAQLAQFEEDFTPAGSIGPEVELVFANHGNPFQESFAEEEVVIDRYAAIDTGSFAGLPTVSSAEGRELGSRLNAAAAAHPTEKARAARESEPWATTYVDSVASQQIKSAAESSMAPSGGRARSGTVAPGSAAALPVAQPVSKDPSSPSEQHLQSDETGVDDADDRDLIVIEDDAPLAAMPPKNKPLVKRQEYRQLFAKLRRG